LFLVAIESVLDGLERARLQEGGMLTGGSKRKGSRAEYSVSLAVSLEEAARNVPFKLAQKMRKAASANDQAFAGIHPSARQQSSRYSANWSNAYGSSGPVAEANVCMLRYRQVPLDTYRRFVLQTADGYREADVDLSEPVWPGTLGNVVLLMLNAYELTSEDRYVKAADRFARKGVELFLTDACPLPKASHVHNHYEAVTNGDTLMMSFLRLWQVKNRPELKAAFIFTDR
jgi:hypothetical protein